MSCDPSLFVSLFVASTWFEVCWILAMVGLLVMSVLVGRDNWRHLAPPPPPAVREDVAIPARREET